MTIKQIFGCGLLFLIVSSIFTVTAFEAGLLRAIVVWSGALATAGLVWVSIYLIIG